MIKYLFCINTGRSGSGYLQSLFCHAHNTVSIHEGFPIMNGEPMRFFNRGDAEPMKALIPKKLDVIKRAMEGSQVYSETNHSFIKGWGWLLPDAYIPQEEIGVVILTREPEGIINSILRLHSTPGTSEWSKTWWLNPGDSGNLCQPEPDANPYDICKWYVDEVALRAEAYKKQFPKITYVHCDLKSLNDYDFVEDMFSTFGLTPKESLKEILGQVVNQRGDWHSEVCLQPPLLPSAETLDAEEKDKLIDDMIEFLFQAQKEQFSALEPTVGGSVAGGVAQIINMSEKALEDRFGYSFINTDFERTLINEAMFRHAPDDVAFMVIKRFGPPNLRFSYDFNLVF